MSLVAVLLVFTSVSMVKTSAATKEDETPNTVLEIEDPIITPFSNIIYVDKPIAETGYLSNYKLGQMIERYDKGANWLNIINTVVYAGGPAGIAGVANSLASSFGADPSKLRKEYHAGNNAYYCSVYASGVAPSLSKIAYVNYSKTNIIYKYQK